MLIDRFCIATSGDLTKCAVTINSPFDLQHLAREHGGTWRHLLQKDLDGEALTLMTELSESAPGDIPVQEFCVPMPTFAVWGYTLFTFGWNTGRPYVAGKAPEEFTVESFRAAIADDERTDLLQQIATIFRRWEMNTTGIPKDITREDLVKYLLECFQRGFISCCKNF